MQIPIKIPTGSIQDKEIEYFTFIYIHGSWLFILWFHCGFCNKKKEHFGFLPSGHLALKQSGQNVIFKKDWSLYVSERFNEKIQTQLLTLHRISWNMEGRLHTQLVIINQKCMFCKRRESELKSVWSRITRTIRSRHALSTLSPLIKAVI
jgi:hypothetical protein